MPEPHAVRRRVLVVASLVACLTFGAGAHAASPVVTTNAATEVRATTATVNATINPGGVPGGTHRFEYGTTAALGTVVPNFPLELPDSSDDQAVSWFLTGLAPQ